MNHFPKPICQTPSFEIATQILRLVGKPGQRLKSQIHFEVAELIEAKLRSKAVQGNTPKLAESIPCDEPIGCSLSDWAREMEDFDRF